MIDLLVARNLIESGTERLCWVPAMHMLADVLTKAMQCLSLVRTKDDQDREQHHLGTSTGTTSTQTGA